LMRYHAYCLFQKIPNRLHVPTRDRRVQQDRLLDDGGLRQIVL